MSKVQLTAAALSAVVIATAPTVAQSEFPSGPLTIIVPFSAGGASDLTTRAVAEGLSQVWGSPVVVENRPGGGTIVGNTALLQAAADGYTLSAFTPTFVINPAVRSTLPYDSLADFRGVSMMVESPSAIVANADFPADDLQGLIAEVGARGAGSPVTYSSPGPGSFGHLAGEMLMRLSGIQMQHVPYGGSTQALPDLLAGRVDLIFTAWVDVRSYVESGDLKLIAPYSDVPLGVENQPPAISEVFPEFTARAFTGLMAPAGVPDDVMAELSRALEIAINSPQFAATASSLGAAPWFSTPAETDTFIRTTIENWTAIATDLGISLD